MTQKQKLIPRFPLITGAGCLFSFLMLAVGGALGLMGGWFGLPLLLNYDATQNAQNAAQTLAWGEIQRLGTAQAALSGILESTAFALQSGATESALQFNATQSALTNELGLLQQTATYSALSVAATQTANVQQNAQQMTQAALSYAGTQAALAQNATIAALGGTPNAQAATAAPSATVVPSATTIPLTQPLPFDMTATPIQGVVLDDTFALGIQAAIWDSEGWQQGKDGLQATDENALLISKATFGGVYRVEVTFIPALSQTADYEFGFAGVFEGGLAVRFTATALKINMVELHSMGINPDSQIATQSAEINLSQESMLTLDIQNATVRVMLNGTTALTHRFDSALNQGWLMVRLPQGAVLKQVRVIQE